MKATGTMECWNVELSDFLPFYLNGDVTSEQAQEIETHLTTCPMCQDEVLFWVALGNQGLPIWRQFGRTAQLRVGEQPAEPLEISFV